MKNNYFKHLFTMLLLLCATVASAHDFEVDSIYYNIKDDVNKTVEVTYRGASYRDYSDEYTGSVAIPEVVIYNGVSYSIASIGDYAFCGCTGLTSIEIPNSVKSIGDYTFALCSGLTGVEIPNSVTSIEDEAFYNCSGLTSITIPNSVTSIKRYAFEGCENLASVHISDLAAWCNIEFGIFYAYEIPGPGGAVKAPENRKSKSSNYSGWYGLSSNPLVYGKLYLNGELIKDIVIPDGVSKIKANAFCGYRALESVKIPNSVTSIGTIAFRGCTSLTSIEIPNGVTIIRNGAFYGCSGLTGVEIPNSVTSIEDEAFYNCSGLTSITIPNSVTSIERYAFEGCSGLTGELVIPGDVTSIGYAAFRGCSGLTIVTIPNSVTSIGEHAFDGCTRLKEIYSLSAEPVRITSTTFDNYSATLYVPSAAKDAYEKAAYWKDFTNIVDFVDKNLEFTITSEDAATVAVTGYTGNNSSVIIPLHCTIDGKTYTVTSIGESVFSGCASLTSIMIPCSVTSIGDYAFDGCEELRRVYIDNLVAWCSIDFSSPTANPLYFAGNLYLNGDLVTELVIPEGITEIKKYAFRDCSGLTSITIPNSVTSIGELAFYDCSGLTSIEIPGSITSIGAWAFSGTAWYDNQPDGVVYAGNILYAYKGTIPSNTSIVVKDGTLGIAGGAFDGCSWLTSITIPNSVTSIGMQAFNGCSGLTSVEIGNNVENIGKLAFKGCSGLTCIEIPGCVTSIGELAFYYCSGLKAVRINDLSAWCNINFGDYYANPLSYAENLYLNGKLLTELVIPDDVKEIETYAFYNCSGLTNVEIPNSVTSIGDYAFYNCSRLTSVEIGNNVESIGNLAFYGCSGLKEIYSLSAEPAIIQSHTFKNYSATLYVPGCAKDAYEKAAYWKNFTNIVDFVDKDLEFTITSEENATAAVTDYTGNQPIVEIPSHCTIDGKRYTVTSIGNNAFDGYTGLASIEIPNTVTSIGDYAFRSCVGLTSLEIPNSVTSIGYNAFVLCTGLKSIEIPASVTNIENSAFSSCSGLESIVIAEGNAVYDSRNNCNAIIETATNTLLQGCQNTTVPSSVTGIGHSAFYLCAGLKSIEIANSVTSIGNSAFQNCTNLSSVVIGNGVTSIGDYAFRYCEGLTSVEIGNNVENIGDYAFYGCSGLTGKLVIPNSVTSIGWSAFNGCSGLTGELVIPNSVTSIESCAFEGCSGLTGGLVIPNSVTSIESRMFYGCSGLTGELVIPNSVTSIGWSAFNGCSGLTSVEFGSNVENIEEFAFNGCSGLTGELVIPNSVTSIGESAFNGCSGLTGELVIPNGVTIIRNGAFNGCSGLTSVVIGNGVTSIGSKAFGYCSALTSIEIPNSVASIGYDAFRGTVWFDNQPDGIVYAGKVLYAHKGTMPENTSVTVKEGTLSITDEAFNGCTGLASIEIPSSVTKIGVDAFYGCAELKTVVNFSELTVSKGSSSNGYIAYYADKVINAPNGFVDGEFAWGIDDDGMYVLCSYFGDATELTLPADCKGENYKIGDAAFDGCTALTSVEIPNSVTNIGSNAFRDCEGLTSVVIGNGVTSIGDYAFERCRSLTSVELPVSLRSIGENAFARCTSLVSVLICENVENIGTGAFNSCNKLKSITSLIPAEKLFAIPGLVTAKIYRTCTLYVHIGAGETYAATEGWSRFVNIVEQDLSDIEDVLGEDLDNAVFYDLNGRVVEYPTNGIYIVNGKKVLVK